MTLMCMGHFPVAQATLLPARNFKQVETHKVLLCTVYILQSQSLSFITDMPSPEILLLENCSVKTSLHLILVECTYLTQTTVTGFQVIARAPDYSETHKLYSSKAVSPQRQVAIPVEEDGLYQVTVLGIRRGAGILQSDVEYEEMLIVNKSVRAGVDIPNNTLAQLHTTAFNFCR